MRVPASLILLCLLPCSLLAGCGQAPATTSPAPHHGPAMQTHHPRPTVTPLAPTATASLTPHPVADIQTTPPVSLGSDPLPPSTVTDEGYGEVRATPEDLQDREFTLPDTLPELPGDGFTARVQPAPSSVIDRSSWSPACPVAADELAWVRLTFRGFDHTRHTGELLVRRDVASDVVAAFHQLWDQRFPIEEMAIKTSDEVARVTGDDNDTSAFECRPDDRHPSREAQELAQGRAVEVDPFQNPAQKEEHGKALVKPALAGSYLDRTWDRPGMISPGGPVVRAFEHAGWSWGGPDEAAHFSH